MWSIRAGSSGTVSGGESSVESEADATSQIKMLRQHPLGASALASFGEFFANALIFLADVRVYSVLSHALVLEPRVTDNLVAMRRMSRR